MITKNFEHECNDCHNDLGQCCHECASQARYDYLKEQCRIQGQIAEQKAELARMA